MSTKHPHKQHTAAQAPISALFDDLAQDYDELRREVGWDPWPHIREALGDGPLTSLEILDAGCASGETCQLLTRRGAKMTGLDISPQMCQIARKRAPRANILQHDLQAPLPFKDQSFDAVFALGVMEFCSDIEATFKELIRVLKPQGTLLCVIELCGEGLIGGNARTIPLYEDWRRYRLSEPEAHTIANANLNQYQIIRVQGYLQDEHNKHTQYARIIGKK